MADAAPTTGTSASLEKALLWAAASADLRGPTEVITATDAFIGALLSHPDEDGEARRLLQHFGLTARDLLPEDFPAITREALRRGVRSVNPTSPRPRSADVDRVISAAQGFEPDSPVQLVHLVGALLSESSELTPALYSAFSGAGVELTALVDSYRRFLGTNPAASDVAGRLLGDWLISEFPRTPVSVPAFSSDKVDADKDLIGIRREADAFAYLLASRALKPPLAVGLFGDWGSGKSFLMASVRKRIEQLVGLAGDRQQAQLPVWRNVRHIEFNAWEYVQTNLWAALLDRIFQELTPEARQTLAQRSRGEVDTKIKEQAAKVLGIENTISKLQDEEVEKAKELKETEAEKAKGAAQAEQQRAELITEKAKERARAALVHLWGEKRTKLLGDAGVDLVDALEEARLSERRAPMLQDRYWTPLHILYVALAAALIPALALFIDQLDAPPLVSALGGLSAVIPLAAATIRSAAVWMRKREDELIKAKAEVQKEIDTELAAKQKSVDDARKGLAGVRGKLAARRVEASNEQRKQVELETTLAELTPGRQLAQYAAKRAASSDYRSHLDLLSTVHRDLRELETLVRDYNEGVSSPTEHDPPNRIILYIDDLDRCPPDKVVQVLEAVHLLLAFELFVVVVAVDTRWLMTALSDQLKALQHHGDETGQPTAFDYVEKIFQLPYWVERLDDAARQRLLRGLLVDSVSAGEVGDEAAPAPSGLEVGDGENELVVAMLTQHGLGLHLDTNQLSISAAELRLIESLAPLLGGTPRRIKRFVNICQLLLAMAPKLAGQGPAPTERDATCFMAAIHEGLPHLSAHIARVHAQDEPSTLGAAIDTAEGPQAIAERERLTTWLAAHPDWKAVSLSRLLVRFDVIQRLRFDPSLEPEPPQVPDQVVSRPKIRMARQRSSSTDARSGR